MIQILQALVVVVVIGVVYSLWQTTKAYGGLIGGALKWIGLGIVFFTIEAFDRVFGALGNFSLVSSINTFDVSGDMIHNSLLLLGLLFCGIGFSRLTRIAK